MSNSYQNEIPKARVNIKLDVHTGGAARKMELPLKLLVTGDFSNGQEDRVISEREKVRSVARRRAVRYPLASQPLAAAPADGASGRAIWPQRYGAALAGRTQ